MSPKTLAGLTGASLLLVLIGGVVAQGLITMISLVCNISLGNMGRRFGEQANRNVEEVQQLRAARSCRAAESPSHSGAA